MDEMTPTEPQSALDYDDRTSGAVKSVLIEIGQILGSFRGKFAVIGGAVPWLLLDNEEMSHVGTMDIDLMLDAQALMDNEYASLVEALMGHGYHRQAGRKRFQLVRRVAVNDGGPAIDIVVDFLMPRGAKIQKHTPPLIDDFAVQRADGADLATRFHQMVEITGAMPEGGTNRVEIAVCSIPALLAMKGYALNGRLKQKDAYDVYFCVRNYPEGIAGLARDCGRILEEPSGVKGFEYINLKFATFDSFGPTSVRRFVQDSQILGERTPEQWQQDAFGQVDALLRELKLRGH